MVNPIWRLRITDTQGASDWLKLPAEGELEYHGNRLGISYSPEKEPLVSIHPARTDAFLVAAPEKKKTVDWWINGVTFAVKRVQ